MVSLLKSALASTRRTSRGSRCPKFRADFETLESRRLLSGDGWPGLLNPQSDDESNDTLDEAQDIGSVSRQQIGELVGSIGSGVGRDTDVDWFRFTLESAGRVQITSLPNAFDANTPVLLTLYGDQLAEFDPALPLQHRLLGRREFNSEASSGAQLDLRLPVGTFFLSVSGAGNRHFHPFVMDSGLPGLATDYGVQIALVDGRPLAGNHDQFVPELETGRSGDDTSATATDLGDFSAFGRLQVSGAIGDDPFYNVSRSDPFASNPAADVDLYRFSISGSGQFALIAEAFAGRIGSPLDPALTLFRADGFGSLKQIATNNNTLNDTQSTNGQIPFFSDAALFSGLSAGEYFVAISSSGNDAESGPDGLFDPLRAHSGLNGGSIGKYVLDLLVSPDATAPRVLATSPANESTHNQSPRHIEVHFSELVNLQQLAHAAFTQVGASTVRAVFIEGSDGARYFPRLQSYDVATGAARFLMLDGLPNGEARLHLSGALGLTDTAGNPLVGNDSSGDYVARFNVTDTTRGATRLQNAAGNETLAMAQRLGVLFPHELQAGVTLTRDAATNSVQPADTADYFRFELLQTQSYFVTRTNTGSSAAPSLKVLDLNGRVVPLLSQPRGQGLLGFLPAGKYVLRVGPWDAATSGDVKYRVEIELGGASENPTPLTSGAAPAVGIRLHSKGVVANSESQTAQIFARPQPSVEQSLAIIPSGLLQGFHAPALGGQGLTPPGVTRESALVRLFGFSDRDRLFSLIDATLPRASDRQRLMPVELTDDALSDILNLNRPSTSDVETDTSKGAGSPKTSLEKESPTDSPTEDETSTTNGEATDSRPVSQSTFSGSAVRSPRSESRVSEEQPPAASSAPLALALATSLASTLRESARRDFKGLSAKRRAMNVRKETWSLPNQS